MRQNASRQRFHAETVALTVKVFFLAAILAVLLLVTREGREWGGLSLVCALSATVLALALLLDSTRCGRKTGKAEVMAPRGSGAKAR